MLLNEFKSFLTKTNAIALAIGVVIGAATQNLVSAVVDDVCMPLIALMLPAGDWRDAQIILSQSHDVSGKITVNAVKYGHLFGAVFDFIIIAFVVFLITKMLLKDDKAQELEQTRICPECMEKIPIAARKCRACTSSLVS